jgi:hypothetical protein
MSTLDRSVIVELLDGLLSQHNKIMEEVEELVAEKQWAVRTPFWSFD